MNKIFVMALLGLLLVSSVSAYYCADMNDNPEVVGFKSSINRLALEQDVETHDLTREAIILKIKYFNKCE